MFPRTLEEQSRHVHDVLILRINTELTLKLRKRVFSTNNINHLGHVVGLRRLETASHRTDAFCALKAPKPLMEFWSFHCLCNLFHRFVRSFAQLAAHLGLRLQNDQRVKFGHLNTEKLAALVVLKHFFVTRPVSALSDTSGHTTRDTDVCNVQVNCIFLQNQSEDNSINPVSATRTI